MKRLLFILSTSILFGVTLLGCSAAAANPAIPVVETPRSVAQAVPTIAVSKQSAPTTVPTVAAPEQPASATRTATYDGITFTYPASLAKEVQAVVQPAVPAEPDGPYWIGNPEFVQFKFGGYVLPKTFHEPRIEIYPTADFRKINKQAGLTIDDLQKYLKNRSMPANGKMPFLPIFNAAQALDVAVKNLNFQNGTGVRYLTQYDQGPMSINNNELFYTYQGLTKDGRYYVAAILPISNPILPADSRTNPPSDYLKYIASTTQKLESQSPSSYQPDLSSLDALIESLTVHGK